MTGLCSPTSGRPLAADTPTSLTDGDERWPVLDGIPYLRAGRDAVRARALDALDAGHPDDAAAVLLADQDDWWDQAPPDADRLRRAHHARSLREAVEGLGLDRVGDYFLHRDHDPSALAVLALTAAHPPADRPVLDLACGAGHLLRHLARHGHTDLTGLDVVFAKLWLARRFVLPAPDAARLVCADLTAPWPVVPGRATYVACHDALYFLDEPAVVLDEARHHAGPAGAVVAAHCHNADHPAGAAGRPRPATAWTAMLPDPVVRYTEEELTAATLRHGLPVPADDAELAGTEAVALAHDGASTRPEPRLLAPPPHTTLRVNPLYVDGVREWPNPRWADEYGARAAAYLPDVLPGEPPGADDERWTGWRSRRLLVDLPERW